MGGGMSKKRITRLLIANRGEIACRIIASCKRMGIETVTLFAQDDRDLPHAQMGDFNCLLEGDALKDTYLNMKQILEIAKRTKADAVHPGYGFLSENAAFAKAVKQAGLIFVGPPAKCIVDMGDKAASRQLCDSIGVPVIPGYDGDKQDVSTFKRIAKKIGYPVLVKASAGGGGKGMRVVAREADLAEAITSAKSEAESSFGNGQLLLEKYLVKPRHIEVQVFSDTHGNHVHLFERECSVQRRHQKVIEESPAPNLSSKTRSLMCACAVTIASHIKYEGAGTVEFIMDAAGDFYFLEMNTRLQVEHPVTEWVTGLDLVQLQLDVAQGGTLPFAQEDITQTGHAVEVRLYAEDAERGFLPAAGTLTNFTVPSIPGVRCETGYRTGNVVTSRYDPMIAKLAAYGATREEAIATAADVLSRSIISGLTTNRAFLIRALTHPAFIKGVISTDFLVQYEEDLRPAALDDNLLAATMAAHVLFAHQSATSGAAAPRREQSAWTDAKIAGWRCN